MYKLQQAVNSTIFIFLQINSTLNSWMFCVLKPPKKFNKYTLRANINKKIIGMFTAISKSTFDESIEH